MDRTEVTRLRPQDRIVWRSRINGERREGVVLANNGYCLLAETPLLDHVPMRVEYTQVLERLTSGVLVASRGD